MGAGGSEGDNAQAAGRRRSGEQEGVRTGRSPGRDTPRSPCSSPEAASAGVGAFPERPVGFRGGLMDITLYQFQVHTVKSHYLYLL